MTQKILIAIVLSMTFIVLAAYAFFSGFYYCSDSKPEKILMTVLGAITLFVGVICVIGILSC